MTETPAQKQPNIVLILADDLGFSDVGCFGSEIRTPNVDRLSANGLRMTQMYNAARCCPSRASLLTGVYPHQAGIGHMVADLGVPEYQGYLSQNCATLAEALRAGSYRTLMSGKWHVGGAYDVGAPETWRAGDEGRPTPRQRGFDRFYGMLGGAGSYYNPPTLMEDERFIGIGAPGYYLTDVITDRATSMICEAGSSEQPFFLYVAYTAPHWPLHAFEEDIARYEGAYRDGWDALRTGRHERQKALGIVGPRWEISPRDPDAPPWEGAPHKEWEALRMAVYAAQIDRMDQGIGRIVSTLDEMGLTEDTLIMFLADNGGCAEFLAEDSDRPQRAAFDVPTADGRPLRFGNSPSIQPGPDDTFMSYDLPWANASNAPFRLFKRWVHEGGISTPFIAHWPRRIQAPRIVHGPAHLIDIVATCLDVAGVPYPAELNGRGIAPPEGESFAEAFDGRDWRRERPIFWEHEGNRAVRLGDWKLVSERPGEWELYNVREDRTELRDLSETEKGRVRTMARMYEEWADRCGVRPWPVRSDVTASPGRGRHVHVV